jgi:hypothetical protein
MSPPVDFDTVPFLYPLVATFRLVCGLTEALAAFIYSSSLTSFPTMTIRLEMGIDV